MPVNTRAMHGTHLNTTRAAYAAHHRAKSHKMTPDFTSIPDLWAKIRTICMGPPVHCLHTLEIGAHGSPDSIDGISDAIGSDNTDVFAAQMMQNKDILCDRVHIYCSGCNTGIDFGPWDSIAENIADEIPFDLNDFPHRVSVYGTKGYKKQGTSNMRSNEVVKAEWTKNGRVTHPAYWNGEDATGDAAWNKINNW